MKRIRWFSLWVALLLLGVAVLPVAADGGKNAIFGQQFTLKSGERLRDNLMVFGGSVHLERDSRVEGDVTVFGGQATLAGIVDGDVVAVGGTVEVEATALIEGDLVVLGRVRRHPDARVKGNVVEGLEGTRGLKHLPELLQVRPTLPAVPEIPAPPIPAGPRVSRPSWFADTFRNVGILIAVLVMAALLVLLLPDHLERTTDAMVRMPVLSLCVGVLTVVLFGLLVILSVILILACIGLPMLLVFSMAFGAAGLLGITAAGRWLGRQLTPVLGAKPTPLAQTLLGTALITILGMLPCVGPLVSFVVGSWGLGAAVLTRFGSLPYPLNSPFAGPAPRPSAPPTPPSAPVPLAAPDRPRRPGDTHPLDEFLLGDDRPDTSATP